MNEIIKKNGVTYGIILGLFSVIFITTIYVIDLKLFTSWWLGLVSFAISITIGVVLVSKTKKQMGTMTFKEGFTVYFLAALIGSFISTIFNYVLFNFIDTEAKETIKEITMKYTADMMESFGPPASAVNEAMQKMAETDNYSIGNLLFGLAVVLIFQAIFGLILAAIFKSKSSQGL
jgi:tetrahydromethanopterin S-methyltransferase subunit B